MRRVSFFGARNPDDVATQLSEYLIEPLYTKLQSYPDREFDTIPHTQATKVQLKRLLGGEQTPALLFTAQPWRGFSEWS